MELTISYTTGTCRTSTGQHSQSTRRAFARGNGDTMIFTGNLMNRGLFLAVKLMCFAGQCLGTSFDLGNASYDCLSTLICLGDAHQYQRNYNGSINGNADGNFVGKLSLLQESDQVREQGPSNGRSAIAYYNQSIRLLDRSKNLAASFKTTFAFAQIVGLKNQSSGEYVPGDGMTFVVSSGNGRLGSSGANLGYFDYKGNDISDKSVVVEFDNWKNDWDPNFNLNDIGPNHVALDIGSLLSITSQPADNVGIQLWEPSTVYAWIEYSADTQQLELRISNTASRPQHALLFYKMDLFEVVEEYMWVGFSASTGVWWNYYYVWNWTFESYFSTASLQSHDTGNLIIGLSVGLTVFVALIGGCCFFVLVRRRLRKCISSHQLSVTDGLTSKLASMDEGYHFTYEQLSVATGGFPETAKLGRGGFGSVYRGVLPGRNAPIAVKRIDAKSSQGEREFMAEVSAISQLRHRNLIQLLGWCKDKREFMIVYELMPNGSLDRLLFNPRSVLLSWSQRHNVLRGTAAAIDYLHQGWKQRVIHRDIKASNIMLDDGWNAKLGDFGLARLVDHLRTAATTGIVGTLGYIAPEAASSGKFTEKTDTFAFGVVAMEVATGRSTLNWQAPDEDEIVLLDWVWQRLTEDRLLSVVDKRLGLDYDVQSVEVVLRMGLLCCHPNPESRPSMRQVGQVLAGDVPVPTVPLSKPATVFRGMNSQTSHSGDMNTRSSHTEGINSHSLHSIPFYSTALTHSIVDSKTDPSSASVTFPNLDFRLHRTFQLQRSQSQG